MYDIHPIPETERCECQSLLSHGNIQPPVLNRTPGRHRTEREPLVGEFSRKKNKRSKTRSTIEEDCDPC